MKCDIIISGVGGQGIISIAAAIGLAALENNLHLKQSEVHGMSQRGGDVQSHLRLSDKPVASDIIPMGKADLIISVEPMEALRYREWLKADGWIVTASAPFINIPDYPETGLLLDEIRKSQNQVIIDADSLARESGSVKSANMVILGAASHFIGLPFESFGNSLRLLFSKKRSGDCGNEYQGFKFRKRGCRTYDKA